MKQIIVDFLKWDCERRYGTSAGTEDAIGRIADDYLSEQLLQQTQCTTLLPPTKVCPNCGSDKIIMFDSDNDSCQKCNSWFPAL